MNDPHVVALFYDIEHGDSVSYEKAKSFVHDEPAFRVRVKNKKVCFKLKEHYATESEARQSIDKYIRVWELDAGLKRSPDFFKLKFARAKIVDRNPTSGKKSVSATPVRLKITTSVSAVTIAPPDYPSPPADLSIDPDVQSIYDRSHALCVEATSRCQVWHFSVLPFLRIRKWRELKVNSKKTKNVKRLLNTMTLKRKSLSWSGQLSSTKVGSLEARKREGANDDLTAQERSFLLEAT